MKTTFTYKLRILVKAGNQRLATISDEALAVRLLDDLVHKRLDPNQNDFPGAVYRCGISIVAGDQDREVATIHNPKLWIKLLKEAFKDGDEALTTFIVKNQCTSVEEIRNYFPEYNSYQCAAHIGNLKRKGLLCRTM